MKNILVDMLKAQGFTAAQSMEFACEHTLLSKKYEKQVQTCWHGERTSTLEVKLFVNLEAGVCRVWFYSDGRRDAYKERWYSTLGKRTYNAIAETVKTQGLRSEERKAPGSDAGGFLIPLASSLRPPARSGPRSGSREPLPA